LGERDSKGEETSKKWMEKVNQELEEECRVAWIETGTRRLSIIRSEVETKPK
jgi:hypothetical protein